MLAKKLTQASVDDAKRTEITISTKAKIRNTYTEELIFAVCAPIGSLREPVIAKIESLLKDNYGYEVKRLKLSNYINTYFRDMPQEKAGETKAYTMLMNKIQGGNELRRKFGAQIMAELAINDIHLSRHDEQEPKPIEQLRSRRWCFIIDSIKNKEELELLRELYRDIFYFFSIFSPLDERKKNLLQKNLSNDEVNNIINTDQYENIQYGQNVRNTFVEGDFFMRVSSENIDNLSDKVSRYLNIIFESQIITPTPDEIAMYEAQSAAGNSACLSRQVGASITNQKGEVISRGWNDVPKYGGNLYSESDLHDNRCKLWGYCSNDRTKDILADDILDAIVLNEEVVGSLLNGVKIGKEHQIYQLLRKIIRKNTKVKDLIEFSRAVHAEMHAIIIGSQLAGSKMIGGKLFCTTYPCHNCARHIVVAGIQEIYYIEPYIKSLSMPLHYDSLTESEGVQENGKEKVKILMYDGVAPRRYLEFFLMNRPRKDVDGKLISEFGDYYNPKSQLSLQALPTLEQQAIHSLTEKNFFGNEAK
ncbi:anti-phage dCTP deaminase [Asinibacterium sp. OR53]|uniref:anti-phage dCTP deaminase n=1 Tax=Asinibacterium sp. OR53 TaxID=925409 RepID=UPI0004B957F2|nr:anti-phage dCTP deaminase [Asinibacterium sp. OR53]